MCVTLHQMFNTTSPCFNNPAGLFCPFYVILLFSILLYNLFILHAQFTCLLSLLLIVAFVIYFSRFILVIVYFVYYIWFYNALYINHLYPFLPIIHCLITRWYVTCIIIPCYIARLMIPCYITRLMDTLLYYTSNGYRVILHV